MKSYFLSLFIVTTILLTSCGSQNLNSTEERSLKGNWEITDVRFKEIENKYVNADLFYHGPSDCFVGSTWKLIPNNDTGTYTLNGSDCDTTPMNIKWFIKVEGSENYFWFKQIGNAKARKVNEGYKLKYLGNTGSSFILEHEVPFEGKKLTAVYTFSKLN